MARQVTSYFYRNPADLATLRRTHQRMFPGNELAILEGMAGSKLVKVAYPLGTLQPHGTLTFEQAKAEIEVVQTKRRDAERLAKGLSVI